MKRLLITGANSYIGTNIEKWLSQNPHEYQIETLDLINPNWINFDFSSFDVVLHVAGIVHTKEKKRNKNIFFTINRDLTVEVAKKTKNAGVSHFIFMSTMSIFGLMNGIIDESTIPNPKSYYGISKLEAEIQLHSLASEHFSISIIRPPLIYGNNCKGNYRTLSKFSKKTKLMAEVNNLRSMLFIDNLSEFIKVLIDGRISGVFHPQNSEYVNVTELIKKIALLSGHKIYFIKHISTFLRSIKVDFMSKVFGTLVYSKNISSFDYNYNIVDFEKSIFLSEQN